MPETRTSLVWASVLTALGILVLIALGTWQMHRLQWKNHMLASFDEEYAKDARKTPITARDLKADFTLKRGMLTGVYERDKQVLIGPRVYGQLPGFHVLTPLRLAGGATADGIYIFVDRGWVPADWTFQDEIAPSGSGTVHIAATLRRPGERNPFTPPNEPARGRWYSVDTDALAAHFSLASVAPYIAYAENGFGPATDSEAYPVPQPARPDIPNNHLQYAIFWYIMAAALGVIYVIRFWFL